MISLREAFHLCNVRDDEVIFLREEGSPRYYNKMVDSSDTAVLEEL